MDQIKSFLALAKKHHFWILCGIAMVTALIMYWGANNRQSKFFNDEKAKISSVDSSLNPFLVGDDHPNEKWVDDVHKKAEVQRLNVWQTWEMLYKQQKEQVLVWPKDLPPDFIAAFSQPAANDNPNKMQPLCEIYQEYMLQRQLPHLAEIVDADWPEDLTAPAGARSKEGNAGPAQGDAKAAEKTFKVIWNPADEKRLADAYGWETPPSPLDVRYVQEEMWVTEAICNAIARANAGAGGTYDSAVREIDAMLVGYDATTRYPLGDGEKRLAPGAKNSSSAGAPVIMGSGPMAGALAASFDPKRPERHKSTDQFRSSYHSSASSSSVPGTFGSTATASRPNPPGISAGPPAAAGAGGSDPDAELKDGRYVDGKGKALLAADLANPPFAEYNLMAFRLKLIVDEQRPYRILEEFCNSPLPLEVRGVKINITKDSDDAGGPKRGGGTGPQLLNEQKFRGESPGVMHNMAIEIYGVAYLFNPPDPQKLGMPASTVSDSAAPPAGAAPATGAAPSAAPATGAAPAGAPAPATTGAGPAAAPVGGAPASAPATPAAGVPAPVAAPPGAAGAAPPLAAPADVPAAAAAPPAGAPATPPSPAAGAAFPQPSK